MDTLTKWFSEATGHTTPRPWQTRLIEEPACRSRLIRVPTGQGKTQGILAAWAWHRLKCGDDSWPRRLVWTLPMRVLTEQTVAEARAFLNRAGLGQRVQVHTLMGGADAGDWHLYPEREAVLVGTQDMLLSRALNRGYACARARWPMEYGLLSQDALWVFDEIQLMDVGLATAAQLQAYRDDDADKHQRPVHSWWMSATLQPDWLQSVDTAAHHAGWVADPIAVDAAERKQGPCAILKSLSTGTTDSDQAFATAVLDAHQAGTITLVVCNRVDRASACHDALAKAGYDGDLRLVHSRFRPADRASWREDFLNKDACSPVIDRIIVATQVVEAGVDISARTLVTELAPWPSLVQRFGRCARYEGAGKVVVLDRGQDDKAAKPYSGDELAAAWQALGEMTNAGVGIDALETFEKGLSTQRRRQLYPYDPQHLLLRQESDDLFDTTPDLTGADLDISRFIRSGEERDCHICWHEWNSKEHPPAEFQPSRDALCAVPVYRVKIWFDKQRKNLRPQVFDFVDDAWQRLDGDPRVGQIIVVDAAGGGYDPQRGFTGAPPRKNDDPVPLIPAPVVTKDQRADRAHDREDLSTLPYQRIVQHGSEVGQEAAELGRQCAPHYTALLHLAGRLHDWGKAHPAFQGSIDADDRPTALDLAKAPDEAWKRGNRLYPMPDGQPRRPGFRHELASVLALYELLARHRQDHPALLGGIGDVIACGVLPTEPAEPPDDSPLARELAALSDHDLDLVAYLIASHHGKLRASWHAAPQDQDYPDPDRDGHGQPLRGVRNGDALPAIELPTVDDEPALVPTVELHLHLASLGLNPRYGRSWRERSLALQQSLSPWTLAWLEALLRAADIRVSRGLAPTREPASSSSGAVS